MPLDPIPDDILDLILDYFDGTSQDRQSLIACSFVNRAFSRLSQRRLFREVKLEYDILFDLELKSTSLVENDKTTGRKFLRLLEGSPQIQSYVRALTIEGRAIKSWPFEVTSAIPQFSLYSIARRLDGLHSFSLQGSVQWDLLDRCLKSFLLDTMPRMQRLGIAGVENIPVSVFRGCRNLQGLNLSSTEWDIPETDDGTYSAGEKIKIQSLTVGNPSADKDAGLEIFYSAQSPFDLTHLRKLTLSTLRYSVEGMNRMLSVCGKSLESLEFSVNKPVADRSLAFTTVPPDLSMAWNLRHLIINTCVRQQNFTPAPNTYDSTDFTFIDSIIQTLPDFGTRPSPMLSIDLSITLQELNPDVRRIPWSKLFRSMNDDRIKTSLKRINLKVWKIYGYIRLASLSEILQHCPELRQIQARGILKYGTS